MRSHHRQFLQVDEFHYALFREREQVEELLLGEGNFLRRALHLDDSSGAWVALHDCVTWMKTRDMVTADPLRDHVAAISCGICNGTPVLDLDYAEDSEADTDANFVMTGAGRIVEVQGTAEKIPFTEEQFLNLLALAKKGVMKLVDLQKLAVM